MNPAGDRFCVEIINRVYAFQSCYDHANREKGTTRTTESVTKRVVTVVYGAYGFGYRNTVDDLLRKNSRGETRRNRRHVPVLAYVQATPSYKEVLLFGRGKLYEK